MDFESIMDYGFFIEWIFRILKNMDNGMDMDLVSNSSGPTVCVHYGNILCLYLINREELKAGKTDHFARYK